MLTTIWNWFLAHYSYTIPLLVVMLSSLVTGLGDYPATQSFFRFLLDLISFVTHRNSMGTFKFPFLMRSKPPASGGSVPFKFGKKPGLKAL